MESKNVNNSSQAITDVQDLAELEFPESDEESSADSTKIKSHSSEDDCGKFNVSHNTIQPEPQQPTQAQVPGAVAQPRYILDPEKAKLIKKVLFTFTHAYICPRRENQANGEPRRCNFPHCKILKNTLNHMSICENNTNCTVPNCSSSRKIIAHWKNCTINNCPVCLPFIKMKWHLNSGAAATQSNSQQSPIPSDMRRVCDALGIAAPSTTQPGLLPAQVVGQEVRMLNPGMQAQPGAMANFRLPLFDSTGQYVIGASQQVVEPNVSLPLSSDPSVVNVAVAAAASQSTPTSGSVGASGTDTNQQSAAAATAANIQQQLFNLSDGNQADGLMNDNNRLSNFQLLGGLQPRQVTTTLVQGTKEWHQSVTPDLRNHTEQILFQVLFPTLDPRAMLEKGRHKLVAYVKKIEGDIYEMANSRLEYYYFVAEKIYQLRKELDEKRQKQKEHQLQAQQQQPLAPGAPDPSLGPHDPSGMNANVSRPNSAFQHTLHSHSSEFVKYLPGSSDSFFKRLYMQRNRIKFIQQVQQVRAQQVQVQQAQQQAQAQQQSMMVDLVDLSPNNQAFSYSSMIPNPGLSPFSQPQITTTSVTTGQFPTFIGTTGLPNSSPFHNISEQFITTIKMHPVKPRAAQAAQVVQQQQTCTMQSQQTSTSSQSVTATTMSQTSSPFSGLQQQPQNQQQQQQQNQQEQQFLGNRPFANDTIKEEHNIKMEID